MLLCEEVADSWRDAEEQKADLLVQLRETEQQLQSLIRRPAELDPKIAQNQLDKAQVHTSLFPIFFGYCHDCKRICFLETMPNCKRATCPPAGVPSAD